MEESSHTIFWLLRKIAATATLAISSLVCSVATCSAQSVNAALDSDRAIICEFLKTQEGPFSALATIEKAQPIRPKILSDLTEADGSWSITFEDFKVPKSGDMDSGATQAEANIKALAKCRKGSQGRQCKIYATGQSCEAMPKK